MDAFIFVSFLVGLAIAAPRWGHDSTDGVDSPEWDRRALWGARRFGKTPRGAGAARRETPAQRVPRASPACVVAPAVAAR